jgi:pimeloyl-ACP methyl ester carboxylesterase
MPNMPAHSAATVSAVLRTTGANVYYEVRGSGPGIMLVGCPMDAAAFVPLAEILAIDNTVVTVDPRGINRSSVDDSHQDVTPEMLADDLSQLLRHLALGPVAVFGSSGGAVSALALAQAHPEQVHTVVAHEPPLEELLEDRNELRAVTEDIVATYLSGDIGGAWGKFLASANITLNDDDMAQWGSEPTPQAAADELFFFAHTLRPSTYWLPDLDALRNGRTRIVVGVGEASTGQTCERTSHTLAAHLGSIAVSFPGDHVGFTVQPDTFAECLRTTLADSASPQTSGNGQQPNEHP